MIRRAITEKLISISNQYQVVLLTGPRQSGKTTLVRSLFSDLPYVTLEDPDIRQFALSDPRGFLGNYPSGAIFDEVQNSPDILSYIQGIVDERRNVRFILTGSSNLLLMEKVSQSLAGRCAILQLLPFSFEELDPKAEPSYENWLFKGFYPRIFDRNLFPQDFYSSYIQTYIEKDVRQLRNLGNLDTFVVFLQLCAGRVGQLVNFASLAADAGVSLNTAKAWLSILEGSFVVYRLQPYFENFNKRLVKTPKLYFYDTGVACSLLGIRDAEQLQSHYLRGGLFENMVINEVIKFNLNRGISNRPYFWQDNHGKEIDCLLTEGKKVLPIEIKSGKTVSSSYFDNLVSWRKLSGLTQNPGCVVYGGDKSMKTGAGELISWQEIYKIQRLVE
jgi:predicted AAA+ superfamily ATPase